LHSTVHETAVYVWCMSCVGGDRYFRARVMYVSTDGQSVRSVSVSRGPDASVKTERREVAEVDNGRKVTGRVTEGKSRLYARMSRTDPSIILLFLFGLVLLIGLTVSLCYPTQYTTLPPAKPQVSASVSEDSASVYRYCVVVVLSVAVCSLSV